MSIDVREYVKYNKRTSRYFPDISLINGTLALNRGVKEENIQIADLCTMEDTDTFFSHRGHKGKRGSQAALMQIKN